MKDINKQTLINAFLNACSQARELKQFTQGDTNLESYIIQHDIIEIAIYKDSKGVFKITFLGGPGLQFTLTEGEYLILASLYKEKQQNIHWDTSGIILRSLVELSEEQFVTTKEIAKLLNVSSETVRNYVKQEKIPYIKTLGGHKRYSLESIRSLIDQGSSKNPIK